MVQFDWLQSQDAFCNKSQILLVMGGGAQEETIVMGCDCLNQAGLVMLKGTYFSHMNEPKVGCLIGQL